MTKAEIKADLKKRNVFDSNAGRDPGWIEAFKLYEQETRQKLSRSCGSCYTRIRNWLNA